MMPQIPSLQPSCNQGETEIAFAGTGLHKMSASIHAMIHTISPVRNVLMGCSVSILLSKTKVDYVDLKSRVI